MPFEDEGIVGLFEKIRKKPEKPVDLTESQKKEIEKIESDAYFEYMKKAAKRKGIKKAQDMEEKHD